MTTNVRHLFSGSANQRTQRKRKIDKTSNNYFERITLGSIRLIYFSINERVHSLLNTVMEAITNVSTSFSEPLISKDDMSTCQNFF